MSSSRSSLEKLLEPPPSTLALADVLRLFTMPLVLMLVVVVVAMILGLSQREKLEEKGSRELLNSWYSPTYIKCKRKEHHQVPIIV